MERERQDLERQKQVLIEQREKLRILKNKYEKQQNNETCDKKISNLKKKETSKQHDESSSSDDTDEDVSNRNNKKKRAIYQKYKDPLIESHDCSADEENKYNRPKKPYNNPYEKLKKKIPDMLKQQDMFDKNRTAMEDNYNYLNDAYSTCNMGNCTINGLPRGLKPRS
jgi:ABC-type Zn2+ transport system substrate-binding protein/surface adhesin